MTDELPAFLTAEWRNLVMLNYEIDPAVLDSLVPNGTELDFWNGKTFVSVVGFQFLNTRLCGIPIPFHRNFTEVNLRFYVRRRVAGEYRRGVVFIKEVVPLPAVTLIARSVYNENYVTRRMQCRIELPVASNGARGSFAYSWKSGADWIQLVAETKGEIQPLSAGSQEQFITEHYWGYARQRDGGTMEYGVEHPTWQTWQPHSFQLKGDIKSFYGDKFGEILGGPPTCALIADGSAVVVRKGSRLT